jgi:SAM-dependent methyltransferase
LSESWVYRSAWGYGLALRVLYGRYYTARDTAVAALVPVGSSVLELCCGPARLYLRELRSRTSSYVGIDANTGFVERLAKRGVDARVGDVASADLQRADVVLMQASLYHFLPDAQPMLERMRAVADERVIVSEPVRNLAASGNPLVAWIGSRGTATAAGEHEQRFDEASLDTLMGGFGDAVRSARLIPGGREKVYVLDPA